MSPRRGSGPLAGVRVVDFTRVLAGPYAAMLLGDLGADVIKIESPQGDETRSWVPPVDDSHRGTYFSSVNRNKRSVVCDLTDADGWAQARRLADGADVLIENFRPGVMERFDLDYASLRERNPGLVYCSITGFGRGAGSDLAGYDLLVQAVGGLMSITGDPQGTPTKAGVALVDVLCGLHALVGIQAALAVRAARGEGQRVEVDLMSSLLSGLVNQASSALATGEPPARLGNAHPSIAPYELFAAADRELVVAVGNDRQFAKLVATLGASELAADPRFASNEQRVAHREQLGELLTERLGAGRAAHWVAELTAAGVPAGLVNTVPEAFTMAETLGLRGAVEVTGEGRSSRQVANPIALSATPVQYRLPPPDLGEHQDQTWSKPKEET